MKSVQHARQLSVELKHYVRWSTVNLSDNFYTTTNYYVHYYNYYYYNNTTTMISLLIAAHCAQLGFASRLLTQVYFFAEFYRAQRWARRVIRVRVHERP